MFSKCSVAVLIAFCVLAPTVLRADGLSAVKACEADNERPDDTARLTIMPNGESRGSDTAAALIKTARQKAKEARTRRPYNGPHFATSLTEANKRRSRKTALSYCNI